MYDTSEEFLEALPEEIKFGPYFQFASFFVDNKENLKDIMNALGNASNDERRIKGELFYLLSLFILTFEFR